jgi:methyl-accepting chemotaxis protein
MRWTVGTKLWGAFMTLVLVLVGLMAFGMQRDTRVDGAVSDLYTRGVVATQELATAVTMLHRMRGRSFYHLATRDPAVMGTIERDVAEFDRDMRLAIDRARATFDPNGPRAAELATFLPAYEDYARARDGVYKKSRAGDQAGGLEELTGPVGDKFTHAREILDRLIKTNVEKTNQLKDEVRAEIARARTVSIATTACAAFLALAVAWLLNRNVSQRVLEVSRAARRVAEGGLDHRASEEGDDEIAELGVSVNRMTKELSSRLEEQRKTADEQRAQRAALQKAVTSYAAAVDRLARGDLTTIVTREDGELGTLGDNLGAMSRALREMTLRVHETVNALTTATAEITTTTQQQSAGASESAAAVTETVTTVDEVTQSAQQASERAKAVAAAARMSVEVSSAGSEAVERTIESMARVREQVASIGDRILALSEQAQAVGQIITTVNELAEQSNLLALNAAIEAARAGEHGRGFAVVAQEVRNLAEQSKRATNDVRSILGEIQKSTAQAVLATEEGNKAAVAAVERVRNAGERIEQLTTTIHAAAQAADQIVAAAEQQVTGVGQISRAMHSIDQATAQTVEGTRQSERAARDLNELASKLRDAVTQYRV